MRLVLIRHGESQHGFQDVIAMPSGCCGLTAHGFQKVRDLADRFRASGEFSDCAALLCSPVLRARQTADVLAGALPVDVIEQDIDLCEIHPGEADGLSWDDYRARYGTFDLVTSPTRPFSPGGESWAEFLERVRVTMDRLAARYAGQTVIAVTHAGFIVASILTLFDIPRPGTGARIDPDYLSLTEWRISGATWSLARFNDV